MRGEKVGLTKILNRSLALAGVAGLVALTTAGTASASTVGFGSASEVAAGTDTSADRTIAAESFAEDYDVDLDSAADTINETNGGVAADNDSPLADMGDKLGFQASWGMNSGDIITFTFTNAQFTCTEAYLIAAEDSTAQPTLAASAGDTDFNADGDINDVVEIASNFGTLSANGVDTVTLRVNNGVSCPTEMQMVLVCDTNSTEANADGLIDDDTSNPTLEIPAGTGAGTKISVAAAAQTQAAVTIPAAACSNNVLETENQFSFSVSTEATSVIDVEADPSRSEFDSEGTVLDSDADTSNLESAAGYTLTNDSNSSIEDEITLVAADDATLTMTSSDDLDKVDYENDLVYMELQNGGDDTTNNTDIALDVVTGSTTTLDVDILGSTIQAAVPQGTSYVDDLVITLQDDDNGTATRTWSTAFAIDFDDSQYTDLSWSAATSHTWTINGMQAKVPYLAMGYDGFLSFLKATNEDADNSAEIYVDAIIHNYTADTDSAVSNALLTTLAAQSIATISESDIRTALGLNDTDQVHVELTITARGPQNDIHITGFQKDSVGRTVIEVLYNTNNNSDGRVWQ